MPKYRVLKSFTDSQDDNHVYRAGDKYPRSGRGKKERIEELSGSDNLLKRPLIAEVKEEKKEGDK